MTGSEGVGIDLFSVTGGEEGRSAGEGVGLLSEGEGGDVLLPSACLILMYLVGVVDSGRNAGLD